MIDFHGFWIFNKFNATGFLTAFIGNLFKVEDSVIRCIERDLSWIFDEENLKQAHEAGLTDEEIERGDQIQDKGREGKSDAEDYDDESGGDS